MNKSLPALIILILSTNFSVAQRFAIKGGLNMSTARIYDSTMKKSNGFKPGFQLGMLVDIDFDRQLHFTPSLSYSFKGFVLRQGDTLKSEIGLHYIDIAPLLTYYLGAENRFSISGGPVASIAFSGKEKQTLNGQTKSSKLDLSLVKNYGFFDLSLQGGIAYSFKTLSLFASYQAGFVNINNESEFNKRNIRNRVLTAGLIYFLR